MLPVRNSPYGLCARKATLNSNSAIVARNSSAALELFPANCHHAKCFAVTCRSQYIGMLVPRVIITIIMNHDNKNLLPALDSLKRS